MYLPLNGIPDRYFEKDSCHLANIPGLFQGTGERSEDCHNSCIDMQHRSRRRSWQLSHRSSARNDNSCDKNTPGGETLNDRRSIVPEAQECDLNPTEEDALSHSVCLRK